VVLKYAGNTGDLGQSEVPVVAGGKPVLILLLQANDEIVARCLLVLAVV